MTPKHAAAVKIFERDNYRCQFCGAIFTEEQPPLHIHHRVFVSQGGGNENDNKVSCCWECHFNHGNLKNKRLFNEKDNSTINKLIKRYA